MSDDELYERVSSGDESESHDSYIDSNRWRASEPPEEVFTESETNGEWVFEIIGEEVDENGNIMFEVRWDDWARNDGTKTTWNKPATINGDNWKKEQRKIRLFAAKESLEIDPISTTDIHNMETYLVQQAHKEKMNRSETLPRTNLLSDLIKVQAKHQGQVESSSNMDAENQGSSVLSHPKRNNQRSSTRQKSEISLANSVRGSSSSRSSAWRSQSSFSSISTASTPLSSVKSSSSAPNNPPKGKRCANASDEPDGFIHPSSTTKAAGQKNDPSSKKRIRLMKFDSEDETEMATIRLSSSSENFRSSKCYQLSTDTSSPNAQRSRLGTEWSRIAAQHKAAPIYFTNHVDAEAVPQIPPGFLYLESRYEFSPNVPQPAHMEDFLVKCSSHPCVDAASCECQVASALIDDKGTPMFAYTPDAYFAFNVPKGTEVVECNNFCGCTLKSCRNRVSQRPRDVPIEVFKTGSRGWGVRPLVDVRRGKVLGLYTGLVIPRETARALPEHEYVFDLDGDENDEDHPLHHPLFSVDSKLCGNWTRFINHSCAPNLQIYLVVHNIPPANGLPFIVFAALENIPARTEFTFDYDPRAAERLVALRKGKKKKLPKISESTKICICGADACRGVLY